MKFIPAHRHILVKKREIEQEPEPSIVLVPEDYKSNLEDYVRVEVLEMPTSCTIPAAAGDELVIREAFIEELLLEGNRFYLVLENHVMGIIKKEF